MLKTWTIWVLLSVTAVFAKECERMQNNAINALDQ
jgi:hypothetical protein